MMSLSFRKITSIALASILFSFSSPENFKKYQSSYQIGDKASAQNSFYRQSCSYVKYLDGQAYLFIEDNNGETKRYLMPSPSIRGWSYRGHSLASYIFFDGQESKVRVQMFSIDKGFGDILYERSMSNKDSFRGWNWDGNTASYLEVDSSGKTKLFIQPFDLDFDFSINKDAINISNSEFDKFNSSWTWSRNSAQYTYLSENTIYWRTQRFDGEYFGNPSIEVIGEGQSNIVGRSCL